MLDEPVAGMTDEETYKTAKLFKKISKERSLIVIEHDIDFVQSLKCPVTVLHEGSVLAEGEMKELKKNPSVIEVYLGR
jgi:urea transport system ATP-binding protein